MMGEHKLGHTVRDAMKAARIKRLKKAQTSRRSKLVMPGKRSLSTRGERVDTWNTKRWTKAREKDRAETLERRRKMRIDAEAKAKSNAAYVARETGERVAA